MSEIPAVRPPIVRYGELGFSPVEFEAMEAIVSEARSVAADLAAVDRLVQRGWYFDARDNKTIKGAFLPYAPQHGIAVLPDPADIEATLNINGYGSASFPTLYAVHMEQPQAVLSAYTEVNYEDQDGDVERKIATVMDLGLKRQRVKTLIMSGFQAHLARPDRHGYHLPRLLVEELRGGQAQAQ